MERRALPRYPPCFVCGRSNAAGLDVTFQVQGREVIAELTGKVEHTGYPGILHGGILATLLDEAMGWAITVQTGRMLQTWELSVRYHRPLPPGARFRVIAEMAEDRGRYQVSRGRVEDSQGEVYARGEGKYRPIPESEEMKVLGLLERSDGTVGVGRDEIAPVRREP